LKKAEEQFHQNVQEQQIGNGQQDEEAGGGMLVNGHEQHIAAQGKGQCHGD